MTEEKRVDFKRFNLTDSLRHWYLTQTESFFVVTNSSGYILYLSETALDFFTVKPVNRINDLHIKELVGENNFTALQNEWNRSPQQPEEVILPAPIHTIPFKISLKRYTDNNESGYFLLFKKNAEIKLVPQTDDYYRQILNRLKIPICIIKNETFFYKNSEFDKLLRDEYLTGVPSFNNWLVQYNDEGEAILQIIKDNFDLTLMKDQWQYELTGRYYIRDEGDLIISVLKRKKEESAINQYSPTIEPEKIIPDQNEIRVQVKEQENQINVWKTTIENEVKILTTQISMIESVDLTQINSKELIENLTLQFNITEKNISTAAGNIVKMSDLALFFSDIAEKIHLVSINSAIESARSGEHGKGFAVISQEIAKLSDEIKSNAQLLTQYLSSVQEGIKQRADGHKKELDSIKEKLIKVEEEKKKLSSIIEELRQKSLTPLTDILKM